MSKTGTEVKDVQHAQEFAIHYECDIIKTNEVPYTENYIQLNAEFHFASQKGKRK